MAYTPFHADWHDLPTADTPITAASLEYIEAGIVAAAAAGDAAVAKTLLDAKGDLIVATAADTPAKLTVGADDTVPVAASGDSKGIVWQKIGNAQIATSAAIAASKLAGFPNNPAVALLGDGSWGALGAPTGAVLAYINAVAPTGWLLCDGSAVSRTTYAALFALTGTAFGAGDGSTTFNLPDLRGRVAVGKGSNAAVNALGDNEGVAEANRRPQHRHTAHTHNVNVGTGSGGGQAISAPNAFVSETAFANRALAKDGGSGTASDSLDAPAYVVLTFIIKT